MKVHFVYKITNTINNKIYIGKHSTNNIEDNYMGSGKILIRAIKKYGIDKFKKEILYEFDTPDKAFSMEAKIVNKEFIKRKDTYNIKLGGEGGWDYFKGTVTVKDKNGNTSRVSKNDSRYLSGELFSIAKGTVSVKDKNNKHYRIALNNHKYLSGELVHNKTDLVTVRDNDNNTFSVSVNDPRYLSGELVFHLTNIATVKDKDDNIFCVPVNDPRYLSGELVGISKGKHHSEKTKKKISKSAMGKHVGELNSQYGTYWIYNEKLKESKKITKKELQNWIDRGWIKGRKINWVL